MAKLVLAAALLALSATSAAAADRIPLTAAEQRSFGIALASPQPAEVTLSRRYPARVAVPNPQLRVVAARKAGVVETLLVAEGETVTAGQVLARLQSPDLVAAQSDYLESLTRLALAESQVTRDRMLQREGVIAERRLLESQARRDEHATLVEQRQQVLELAGMSTTDIDALARSRTLTTSLPVRAPIGGVVLEQMVSTGESLTAATPLYRIADLKPLWIEVHVPVDRIEGLAPGARALLPEVGIEGRIITIGRLVHREDQGVLVRAEVSAGAEQLRPGQFIEVQLAAAAEAGGRWRVPAEAMVRHAGAAYMFVARQGGFEPVSVRLIADEEGESVVAGPLTAADRIAAKGVVELKAAWLGAGADIGADIGADVGAEPAADCEPKPESGSNAASNVAPNPELGREPDGEPNAGADLKRETMPNRQQGAGR
ncbi:efflux RND transporter periplasmic adaptor subunit [Halochromatium glycolicum]|uniref:efflux RND transporter periplasmic adaptor subunit n=1 Tax=Halochromatium glycolicum TaxID=85075 RepID=UPI001F5BAAFF|nr:efflux RND transporter periplasmic adaptor subunit [Halochromatium glycolicum]